MIADKLNVSVGTVNGDLKFSSENDGATVTNSRGQERPATYRKPGPRLRGERMTRSTEWLISPFIALLA